MISVLLVEDNPDDEALALRALGKNAKGIKVNVVRDGQEALDFLFGEGQYKDRKDEELPIVVLLDLKLPKLNGLDVLSRIRANLNTKKLPVVMMTTSSQEEDINQAYSRGINSYIRKPVEYRAFLKIIEQLEIYWLITNQPPTSNTTGNGTS